MINILKWLAIHLGNKHIKLDPMEDIIDWLAAEQLFPNLFSLAYQR